MSESRQKTIERNRAPRVQIAYDVERRGSPTTIELPFVCGVMADLGGASETKEASRPLHERKFVETDAGHFGDFMKALSPRVKARVPNRLPGKEGEEADDELFVDVSFRSMGDFTPDRMAEQVPAVRELLEIRRKLEELLSYMDGKVDAEKRIARLLADEPLLARLAEEAATTERTEG